MALKLGVNSINKLYLGSTAINKAYLGATVVFSGGGAVPFSPASLFAGGQKGLWLEVVKSVGFDPASLFAGSTEGALFDPSDLSTLFQDSAGTTPVTASGQPVGKMLDKSGNGNHATQATYSKRPTYTEGGGLSWLAFDGVDDAMVTGAIDFTGTDKVGIFTGTQKDDNSTRMVAELSASVIGNNGSFFMLTSSTYASNARGDANLSPNQRADTNTVSGANTSVITALSDIPADSTIIRRNGSQEGEATGDKGGGNFGNYPLYIGSRDNSSLFLKGKLYGLIIPGKLASAGEIASTEAYMASKTGVTL